MTILPLNHAVNRGGPRNLGSQRKWVNKKYQGVQVSIGCKVIDVDRVCPIVALIDNEDEESKLSEWTQLENSLELIKSNISIAVSNETTSKNERVSTLLCNFPTGVI